MSLAGILHCFGGEGATWTEIQRECMKTNEGDGRGTVETAPGAAQLPGFKSMLSLSPALFNHKPNLNLSQHLLFQYASKGKYKT
ncbi:hypothetical protein GBA52_022102 [Prunus armeniaca]|nr:hypothetical protein GBA52_022102 [Prunus armeniaca]